MPTVRHYHFGSSLSLSFPSHHVYFEWFLSCIRAICVLHLYFISTPLAVFISWWLDLTAYSLASCLLMYLKINDGLFALANQPHREGVVSELSIYLAVITRKCVIDRISRFCVFRYSMQGWRWLNWYVEVAAPCLCMLVEQPVSGVPAVTL